jgi:multidrug transporter EmrE-like cation transporter
MLLAGIGYALLRGFGYMLVPGFGYMVFGYLFRVKAQK